MELEKSSLKFPRELLGENLKEEFQTEKTKVIWNLRDEFLEVFFEYFMRLETQVLKRDTELKSSNHITE
jgi:hypothetical protein